MRAPIVILILVAGVLLGCGESESLTAHANVAVEGHGESDDDCGGCGSAAAVDRLPVASVLGISDTYRHALHTIESSSLEPLHGPVLRGGGLADLTWSVNGGEIRHLPLVWSVADDGLRIEARRDPGAVLPDLPFHHLDDLAQATSAYWRRARRSNQRSVLLPAQPLIQGAGEHLDIISEDGQTGTVHLAAWRGWIATEQTSVTWRMDIVARSLSGYPGQELSKTEF